MMDSTGPQLRQVSMQVPAVVGGKTIKGSPEGKEEGEGSKQTAGLDPRQATYGQKGPSATGVGKQVMKDAEQGLVSDNSSALSGTANQPSSY